MQAFNSVTFIDLITYTGKQFSRYSRKNKNDHGRISSGKITCFEIVNVNRTETDLT